MTTQELDDYNAKMEIFAKWNDPDVLVGGVTAAGSKCMCRANAATHLHSPRWGDWEVCSRCAIEQFTALHGLATLLTDDGRERVLHQAVRNIRLNQMLGL